MSDNNPSISLASDRIKIGVYGSWRDEGIPEKTLCWAYNFGQAIANSKHILVTGGTGGVLLEARRGCKDAQGINIGIIPEGRLLSQVSKKRSLIDIVIPSGMGALGRMSLITQTVHIAFALGGGAGTLTEIALTYLQRKPVIVINGLQRLSDPDIRNLLTRYTEFELEGVQGIYGWIDSKSEDMVAPVYIIEDTVAPKLALNVGISILRDSGINWSDLPPVGPLDE